MSTAVILLGALALDALLGEPYWLWSRLPHPAVLMGRLIGALDARFNRGTGRKLKGIACVLLLITIGGAIGWGLSLLGPLVQLLCAAILLAHGALVQHVADVAAGLRRALPDGRTMVARIVSRDTRSMDEAAVARAAIESGAENLSDGVIAPAFWFALAGLPGLVIYKMVNTADSMIGYRTPRHADFGWAAARLDDLLNLAPARLTALLIALPAGVLDIGGIRRDARLHRSPNAGWPEAAMSRAIGVALAGPRAYDGAMRDFPFVNTNGRRELGPLDIDASIAMLWRAWAGFAALCALAAVL
ncbi:adenosylcobinamide-phosphate synthase CbiB [uncultured Roseobacter sp.]|uniref:adenosylcobinamide-phosphate synthase CbiB n=1 Tax=uncultured Roseobacter sp. TaxID=114847 RepID=UPI00261946EB|nr:adenosylcobinamide-phosphate synthase CbiB [uncultured Roseobacter sp.]